MMFEITDNTSNGIRTISISIIKDQEQVPYISYKGSVSVSIGYYWVIVDHQSPITGNQSIRLPASRCVILTN